MREYELTPAALPALNDAGGDYLLSQGPACLDEALDVPAQLAGLTQEERQLRAELEDMPRPARATLSRAIRTAGKESR